MSEALNPHNLYLGTNNNAAMNSSIKGNPTAMPEAYEPISGEEDSTSLNFSKSMSLLKAAYTQTRINSEDSISKIVARDLMLMSID